MTDEQRQGRIAALVVEELMQPETLYYLSFAIPGTFLGGAIVRAHGFVTAIIKTKELGINPGGQVLGHSIPDSVTVNPEWIDRLLSEQELEALFGPAYKPGEEPGQ